jgi:hypothetical protein
MFWIRRVLLLWHLSTKTLKTSQEKAQKLIVYWVNYRKQLCFCELIKIELEGIDIIIFLLNINKTRFRSNLWIFLYMQLCLFYLFSGNDKRTDSHEPNYDVTGYDDEGKDIYIIFKIWHAIISALIIWNYSTIYF